MKPILIVILLLQTAVGFAQSKLVINGAVINIANGAALVIDNPDNTAIIRNGAGYIRSEGIINRVIWTIGTGNGNTYLMPFGTAANYLPVSFSASSGSTASGKMVFSTYATPTWKNSDFLPPTVTNVNSGTTDFSARFIDRFWQLAPQGYTVNPTLTSLTFTYSDNEYAPPNTITESDMIAERWNITLNRWDDYFPPSTINTVNNTVIVSTITGQQQFNWWSLVSANSAAPLPVTLLYFKAAAQNGKVVTGWQTASEQNSDHFEIWRSRDGIQFDSIGHTAAAGNSNSLLTYGFTDINPYLNTSFYKLKSVDRDGRFRWSGIVPVNMDGIDKFSLYPNPASNHIRINTSAQIANQKPLAILYDASGRRMQSFLINSASQEVNITPLPAGAYRILIYAGNVKYELSFIKK